MHFQSCNCYHEAIAICFYLLLCLFLFLFVCLQLEEYIALCRNDIHIEISINEIVLIHSLLRKYEEDIVSLTLLHVYAYSGTLFN